MFLKQRWYSLLVLALFVFLPGIASAEVIRDFSATYNIQSDGSVFVTEHIEYDFEGAHQHGMFRILEKDHPQPASNFLKKRLVMIDGGSVTRDGKSEPYSVNETAGKVEVKIGDPNRTITGLHTYEISYVLRGALSYGTDGAELYWNATGNKWPVPIERAMVQVVAPENTLKTKQTCYQGVVGSTDRCSAFIIQGGSDRATFTAENLRPGEGMTIAQEVNSEKVAVQKIEVWAWIWMVIPAVVVLLVVLVIAMYRRQTYYKPDQPIIAQYEPYAGLLPMYTGVVFDGRLDPHDITAGIVYLAEQGFIKIKHVETKVLGLFTHGDYELTLLRPITEVSNQPLNEVLKLIFTLPTESELINISLYGGILSASVPSLRRMDTVKSEAVIGEKVLLSVLRLNPVANRRLYFALQKNFKKQLTDEGFYEPLGSIGTLTSSRVVLEVLVIAILGAAINYIFPIVGFLIAFVGFVLFIIYRFVAERRTKKGYEARFHLLGFKEFLSVTDKERFDFHNAPEKSPELFMKYLPYAIALKVEDKWAEVFKDITIPQPDWYDGGTSLHAFSAAAFTSDLGTFAASFNASSGTSGSSGGGSSGGGGGGGGGGSW